MRGQPLSNSALNEREPSGKLMQTKDPQPEWKKKGVMYQVPCAECESVYIGKTGRTLEKRISEHKGTVRRHDVKNVIAVHA